MTSNESGKTVEQVCQFLVSRGVGEFVASTFKENKIDGNAVLIMTDEQLSDRLGLKAAGDQVTLRRFCQESFAGSPESKTRKQQLLDMIRTGSLQSSRLHHIRTTKAGRPKQKIRALNLGMKVIDRKGNECQVIVVKAPLGDQNMIRLALPIDTDYDDLLKKVQEAFFPNGTNPIIGDASNFGHMSIVNSHNDCVKKMESIFSIESYLKEKMVAGAIRFYLLCDPIVPGRLPDTDLLGGDELPDLSSVGDGLDSQERQRSGVDHNNSSYRTEQTATAHESLPTIVRCRAPRAAATASVIVTASETEPDPVSAHVSTAGNGIDTQSHHVPSSPSGEVALLIKDTPETIQDCLSATVDAMVNVSDPVEVLRCYQGNVLQGRALDPSTEFQVIEGQSLNISVSRYNIFMTAAEELLDDTAIQHNYRVPLEVDFYGEGVSDYGGPRKEFFHLIFKTLLDENEHFFTRLENSTLYRMTNRMDYVEKKYFYVAGLICGLSMLQSGPMPCFLDDEDLDAVLTGNGSEAQLQFRMGLDVMGIVRLIDLKPCIRSLLRPSGSSSITRLRLLKILKPSFDIEGSNLRREQEKSYAIFRNYVREVAAGRRNNMELSKILQFTTGTPTEPVLGFEMQPSLHFQKDMPLNFPRAHTCINRLLLPICCTNQRDLFDAFDIAFASEYFGLA